MRTFSTITNRPSRGRHWHPGRRSSDGSLAPVPYGFRRYSNGCPVPVPFGLHRPLLRPKGGRKGLSAFVIFEDADQRQTQTENWMVRVGNAYQATYTLDGCFVDLLLRKALWFAVTWKVKYRFESWTRPFAMDTSFRKRLCMP